MHVATLILGTACNSPPPFARAWAITCRAVGYYMPLSGNRQNAVRKFLQKFALGQNLSRKPNLGLFFG